MVKRARADIRERFGFAVKERQRGAGPDAGGVRRGPGIHRTDLSDIGRARATSDRMRLPVPKRVTAAPSRLAPWGRFPHISGRRRFEDDRDGSVPGMFHTGAGRVASPRLGVGRSWVSICYAAYRRVSRFRGGHQRASIAYTGRGHRTTGMSSTCRRRPCRSSPWEAHLGTTAARKSCTTAPDACPMRVRTSGPMVSSPGDRHHRAAP